MSYQPIHFPLWTIAFTIKKTNNLELVTNFVPNMTLNYL